MESYMGLYSRGNWKPGQSPPKGNSLLEQWGWKLTYTVCLASFFFTPLGWGQRRSLLSNEGCVLLGLGFVERATGTMTGHFWEGCLFNFTNGYPVVSQSTFNPTRKKAPGPSHHQHCWALLVFLKQLLSHQAHRLTVFIVIFYTYMSVFMMIQWVRWSRTRDWF